MGACRVVQTLYSASRNLYASGERLALVRESIAQKTSTECYYILADFTIEDSRLGLFPYKKNI